MQDMEILHEMIKADCCVPHDIVYDKHTITLNEPSAPDSYVTIRNIPEDTFVIKVDNFTAPNAIFNNSKDECKRADFLIISNKKKVVIFIEMKRTKDSLDKIIKQLHGAKCFFVYCKEIGHSFWRHNTFLQNYRFRFISIGHTSIPKKPTRITKRAPTHDTPEKALKIDWPHYLQFNQLAV